MDWKEQVKKLRFEQGKSYTEIAKEMMPFFPDKSEIQVKEKIRQYIRRTEEYQMARTPKEEGVPNVQQNADGTMVFNGIVALHQGEPITPEAIMRAYNIDTKAWKVVSWRSNFWQAQRKGGSIMLLYQTRITVKPVEDEITLAEVKEHFDSFKNTYKPTPVIYKPEEITERMLEVNICDLHLGKLAWCGETGESYDFKIARDRFNQVLEPDIQEALSLKPEKILFVWCHDFFNADGISDATTRGTPQHCDVRWQKMFLVGCEMLVEAIDRLSKAAPVETFYIASNHARQVEFYAINYLSAWFRNYDNVTVHVNCKSRYYYEYGVNLIGFTHSYYEKKGNIPFLMSTEAPEAWARTRYREFHMGHYHCEITEEKGPVIYRWLPSVTGTDAYHYDSGFVGAVKRSYSFVWDKHIGLAAILPRYIKRTGG